MRRTRARMRMRTGARSMVKPWVPRSESRRFGTWRRQTHLKKTREGMEMGVYANEDWFDLCAR